MEYRSYRILHPKAEYTLFGSAHRTLTKSNHILGHKKTFEELKRNYIIDIIHLQQN